MNYINLSTLEFPRHEGDIRIEHPEIGDEFVCPSTYAPVTVTPAPAFDGQNEKTQFGSPYQQDGQWFVNLIVVPFTEEEKAARNVKPSEVEQDPKIKAIMEQIEKELS